MKTAKIPKAPQHLSAEAKQFWREVLAEYELMPEALLCLEAACIQWDRLQAARQLITAEGLVLGGKRHPALDTEKQATSLFLRALRSLGLDVIAPGSLKPGRPIGS